MKSFIGHLIIAIILMVISYFGLHLEYIGHKTEAIITKIETIHSSDGDTYKPTFEFYTRNDEKFVIEYSWSMSPFNYKVGDSIKILYDEKDPSGAVLYDFLFILRTYVVGIIAIIILVKAIVQLVVNGIVQLIRRNEMT